MSDAIATRLCGPGDITPPHASTCGKTTLPAFEFVKVFNLAMAPAEIHDSDQLAPLKPANPDEQAGIMRLRVGQPESSPPADPVTLTEYLLNRWLRSQGAVPGEDILLTWATPD